jgi:hypothetical protein
MIWPPSRSPKSTAFDLALAKNVARLLPLARMRERLVQPLALEPELDNESFTTAGTSPLSSVTRSPSESEFAR